MGQTVDILMPRLSDSMTEGTIIQWLKSPGDSVRMGEDLVEIETDKAQMTYGADQAGVLLEIVAQEGDTLPLGAVIGRLEVEGGSPAPEPAPEPAPVITPIISTESRVPISPVARRRAEQQGIPLGDVKGSGPGGRIVLSDVEGFTQIQAADNTPATVPGEDWTQRETTRLERLVARRMVEGKSAPEFPASRDVCVDKLLELRAQLKQEEVETVPSVNDFVLRAVALALRDHPLLRSSWIEGGERIQEYNRIHLGIAVATESSLLVPVVRDADRLGMGELAQTSRRLSQAARSGTILPQDLEGGVFTVSNLGGMGVDRFQAILVPGQAGILAVGAARQETRWEDETPRPCNLMNLTLTSDHRLVYGAHAAQFLADVAKGLENPLSLML